MNRTSMIHIGILFLLMDTCIGNAAVLYGTAKAGYYNSGHIYKIDTKIRTVEVIADISQTPIIPECAPEITLLYADSPNANAYDEKNNRFYFASFQDPGKPADSNVPSSQLYFIDLDDPTFIIWAGTLVGHASDGTFYNGKYWYIGHGTNVLRTVSLKPSGIITKDKEVTKIWLHDLDSGQLYAPFWSFGDIAFDSKGILYITGAICDKFGQSSHPLSGTFNIKTGQFTEIGSSIYWGQITFGPNRTLYGHDSVTGDFFTIDTADGATKYIFTEVMFTDLAATTLSKRLMRGAFKPK